MADNNTIEKDYNDLDGYDEIIITKNNDGTYTVKAGLNTNDGNTVLFANNKVIYFSLHFDIENSNGEIETMEVSVRNNKIQKEVPKMQVFDLNDFGL